MGLREDAIALAEAERQAAALSAERAAAVQRTREEGAREALEPQVAAARALVLDWFANVGADPTDIHIWTAARP